jgi:hypothetical protein
MPYFEFVHHSRLTDAEWITLLDLPKIAGLLAPRPPLPPWATPIYSTRGQGRPELKAGH